MMLKGSWKEVKAEDVPNCPGVTIRWLISKDDGAPNFCMRLFELQPGSHTPFHTHGWEHEMFILEGDGALNDGSEKRPLTTGDFVLIPAGEEHNVVNTGTRVMRLLCFVPDVDGAC